METVRFFFLKSLKFDDYRSRFNIAFNSIFVRQPTSSQRRNLLYGCKFNTNFVTFRGIGNVSDTFLFIVYFCLILFLLTVLVNKPIVFLYR